MTAHIDTMQEWWKLAEVGIPQAGDTVLFDERHRGRGFRVMQATKDHPRGYDNARILSRAPKPKPAWHDSVAVIAHTDDLTRSAWVRSVADQWETIDGYVAYSDDLRDVTPLIEAKVTDEMVKRGRDIGVKGRKPDAELVRRVLTAALGLESA